MTVSAASAAVTVGLLAALSGVAGAQQTAPPGSGAQGPVTRVQVATDKSYLTLGSDDGAALVIQLAATDVAAFAPVRALASVGTVELPRAAGRPGRFVARYQVPAQRFPQVAIIVVEFEGDGERIRGVVRLPLRASTEMPFRTSPLAEVTLRVADHTFGPIAADQQGRVRIPIVVPPGVVQGTARAVDRDGNVKETVVDLQPAPFPWVMVLAPQTLEVGTSAPVTVYAIDAAGAPAPEGRIRLRAEQAQVNRLGGSSGEGHFMVTAPTRLGVGSMTLTGLRDDAPASDARANVRVAVPLRASRAEKLVMTPADNWLVVGAGGGTTVSLSAEDRFGNPTTCAGATAQVNRQDVAIALSRTGEATIDVPTPERHGGRDVVLVEASLATTRVTREIRLTGGPPTQLTLELSGTQVVADGQRGVEVRVQAVDQAGTPTLVPGLTWEIAGGRLGTIRNPGVGSYVAAFVPRRTREPRDETIAVMASQTLRASATFRVEPPRVNIAMTPRVGLFTNLGKAGGASLSVDAVVPLPLRAVPLFAGLSLGYLRDHLTGATTSGVQTRWQIDQVPILAVARARVAVRPFEINLGAGAGLSLARSRLRLARDAAPLTVAGSARAVALQATAEGAILLPPGHLVIGLRYLWIDLGRTSQGDEIRGNSVGLLADLGYRLTW